MWGTPMFDLKDAAGALFEVNACRKAHPDKYIKVLAFDRNKGFESIRMFFIVNRPTEEPGFDLIRSEGPGRTIAYTIRSYAAERPTEQRYR
jgi:ribulose-bisphosphate carboxylase small chain